MTRGSTIPFYMSSSRDLKNEGANQFVVKTSKALGSSRAGSAYQNSKMQTRNKLRNNQIQSVTNSIYQTFDGRMSFGGATTGIKTTTSGIK
jgi:hypothetical protein